MSGASSGPSNVVLSWADDASRVPYAVFTDRSIYDREQERIFRGPTWNFLALTAEIPRAGDYKATFVGDTPVVVTRAEDGSISAWVNRCAHRGAKICRALRGNAKDFVCVYHQWLYDPQGNLLALPFRRGLKEMAGMPPDFQLAEHGLQKLRVECYRGLAFGTFDDTVEDLDAYIGAQMRPWIDRLFAKPTVYLGCLRQAMNSNWKLYYENVKDPYHGHLLHRFHNSFNIGRPTMAIRNAIDERGGIHSVIAAIRNEESKDTSIYKDNKVSTFKSDVRLNDPEMIRMREEFDLPATNQIQTIFPSLVVQQIHNTLACRQVLPKGPGKFELVFHLFGYEDDDAELREMRLLQANLIGPAGFISMEDGEATELVQQAVTPDPAHQSVMSMGLNSTNGVHSLITEEMIRAFWRGYRSLMDL